MVKINPKWVGSFYSRYKYPYRRGKNAPVVWVNSNTGAIYDKPYGKIIGWQFTRAHVYGSEPLKSKNPVYKQGYMKIKRKKIPYLKEVKLKKPKLKSNIYD